MVDGAATRRRQRQRRLRMRHARISRESHGWKEVANVAFTLALFACIYIAPPSELCLWNPQGSILNQSGQIKMTASVHKFTWRTLNCLLMLEHCDLGELIVFI
jgi:hypothetical protein